MSFISQSPRILCVALVGLATMIFLSPPVKAEPALPELLVSVSDTTVAAGDTSAWINVFFQNYQDTLAGFAMRIVLDRPDIIEFRTDEEDTLVDTSWYICTSWYGGECVDSVPVDPPIIDTSYVNGGIDTAGSLISNWEYITARSLFAGQHDIKVIGLAEADYSAPFHPGLMPQLNPGILFRLNLRVYETMPEDDSTVTLLIIRDVGETGFSDPRGDLFGTLTDYNICDSAFCETWDPGSSTCLTGWLDTIPEVYDTMVVDTFFRYWICQEWGQDFQGLDSCLDWGSYSDPDSAANADSISIDSIPWTIWNESATFITDGHLSVVAISCMCGDASNNSSVDVGDAVFLINYIFKDGPTPVHLQCAELNFDGEINVGDVVYLINYIFKDGPDPYCGF